MNGGRSWHYAHPDLDPEAASVGIQTTSTGAVALVSGEEAVRQALLLLLTTRPGERVMRPRYGCPLHRLVFMPADDTTAGLAMHYVREAVARFAPAVEVVDVDASVDATGPARLTVTLRYRLRGRVGHSEIGLDVPLTEGA